MSPINPNTVTFRIPTMLRDFTSGVGEVCIRTAGATVNDAFNSLERAYPGIRARVLDKAGRPRSSLNVYLNEDDVRTLRGLATLVPQGALISILAAAAGA